MATALNVVEPYGSGLGGGGYFLLYEAKKKKFTFLDAREVAPIRINEIVDSYQAQGKSGERGILSSGIPGLPKALHLLSESYGKLTRAQVLASSVRLAHQGFRLYPGLRQGISFKKDFLRAIVYSKIFF